MQVGAKVSEKVDSAVQTVSHVTSPPPPPSTTAASSTVDQKPPSSPPNPTPSSTNQPLQCEGGSCSQKGQDSGSVTDLASFFSGQSLQRALDAEILRVNLQMQSCMLDIISLYLYRQWVWIG